MVGMSIAFPLGSLITPSVVVVLLLGHYQTIVCRRFFLLIGCQVEHINNNICDSIAVIEDIWQVAGRCKRNGTSVRTLECAKQPNDKCPTCGGLIAGERMVRFLSRKRWK